MSRTRRTKRPQMRLGSLLQHKGGTVPDGTPTHHSANCEHHGGCPYCLRDRTHANERRIMEDAKVKNGGESNTVVVSRYVFATAPTPDQP